MPVYSFVESLNKYLDLLQASPLDSSQRFSRISQLYKYVLTHTTDRYNINFTSIFSRLSFLISSYNLSGKESYLLHRFRKAEGVDDQDINLGIYCIKILTYKAYEIPFDLGDAKSTLLQYYSPTVNSRNKFIPQERVLIKEIDIESKIIYAQQTEEPFEEKIVNFGDPERNEDFTPLMASLLEYNLLPIFCNLVNVAVEESGSYVPDSFVFEPDYLYDVTSISECFGAFSSNEISFILRKFSGINSSAPLIVGNIANHFLDQLVYNSSLEFDEVVQSIFQIDPLGLTLLSDLEIREMLTVLRQHFISLQKVVKQDFAKVNIADNQSFVEPSFYSNKYGIQGRLDLFALKENAASIVELKSGKPFKVNAYGLNNNHYHQTLLYDMLIESVYGYQLKRNNFILYSKESQNQLRFAPNLKSQQRETVKFRNKLFLIDERLRVQSDLLNLLKELVASNKKHIKGYQQNDLNKLIEALEGLNSIELSYAEGLVQFILKEQKFSKLGDDAKERLSGLASLWRDDLNIKKEQFNIINHLEIEDNSSLADDPMITLRRTSETADLSNFRVGDMGILYADQGLKENILRDQVFKCTVLELTNDKVVVRLRSRQENPKIFDRHAFWSIEHDVLDNSFNTMTRSVFEFAKASPEYRRLILGIDPPGPSQTMRRQIGYVDEMTEEQNEVYKQVINAQDYFLLWGPPGTGKTSVLIKNIGKYYINWTNKRILLLAYTNRAVDEICKALKTIDEDLDFIRIGSRYSTSEEYKPYLLSERTKVKSKRSEIAEMLHNHNIYVGTVASTLGKSVLFDIIDFDLAIIDEASQILDPQLIGLLSRFKKFILIGDHKQLPAVVLQDAKKTVVGDEKLEEIGINNRSNSLFERLYRRAESQKWYHAIGKLSYQGRMHQDLMKFPNKHFYNNGLKVLSRSPRLTQETIQGMQVPYGGRLIYVNTSVDMESDSIKVNHYEARSCISIIRTIVRLYEHNQLKLDQNTIGVITPYRAQIACIVSHLRKSLPELAPLVSVDTVERYQGGARDHIIMSACTNFSFQLEGISSISDEGIDRKLNVAFTRAKEQFILIGNADILNQSPLYADLINDSARILIDA